MAVYQSVPSADGTKYDKTTKGISGIFDILVNATLLIVPMLLSCAVLLGLVLYYQVQPQQMPPGSLPILNATVDNAYYYVDFSATRLIFVASWSSTLATLLSAAILTLWSFPVAAGILSASNKEAKAKRALPTPYQLAIVLGMLCGGGLGSLWRWAKYVWSWRHQREKQSRALLSVGAMLILATLLG